MLRLYLMVEASLGCKCLGVGEFFPVCSLCRCGGALAIEGWTKQSVGMRRTFVLYFCFDRGCWISHGFIEVLPRNEGGLFS
jgi:hypothetical protein